VSSCSAISTSFRFAPLGSIYDIQRAVADEATGEMTNDEFGMSNRLNFGIRTSAFALPPALQAALNKKSGTHRKSPEQIDAAIRQLISRAITTEGEIIDVFTAAGFFSANGA